MRISSLSLGCRLTECRLSHWDVVSVGCLSAMSSHCDIISLECRFSAMSSHWDIVSLGCLLSGLSQCDAVLVALIQ